MFQGAANQFHLFWNIFCPKDKAPQLTFWTGSLCCSCGEGSDVVACSPQRFFQSLLLFCSLLFILQSKEYPRNVPENPTRKYVEKEVCNKPTLERYTEKRATGTSSLVPTGYHRQLQSLVRRALLKMSVYFFQHRFILFFVNMCYFKLLYGVYVDNLLFSHVQPCYVQQQKNH